MEDLDYLKVDYNYIIIEKYELIKTLDLILKISHNNSTSIECNSLTFIPDWRKRALTLAVTNDLTYFKNKVELIGNINDGLTDVFSIKVETLNKLKPFFKEKILIYKKDSEYYIRLIDGDLLLHTMIPSLSRLTFTSSINELIYQNNVKTFCDLLNPYINLHDDYSDKWLSFDGEKISLCGLNFYAETSFESSKMCFLMNDIELFSKLDRYYSDKDIFIYSTDSTIPKVQIKVENVEIEVLNVISNINNTTISTLSAFIKEPEYNVPIEAFKRIMNIALNLPDIKKDCLIKVRDSHIVIILSSSKGDSEFSLRTQVLEETHELSEVKLNVDTLNKIINSFSSETVNLTLNKIYTTFSSLNIRAIKLNK